MWSNPADWRWVAQRLRDNGVEVVTPDLPSHRTAAAGLAADAAEVRRAIASASPPVVAVGWSYGGDVISDAAAGEASVIHLVYVASIPRPIQWVPQEPPEPDPHVLFSGGGTFVLDNHWWLTEEDGATMPSHVVEHLWQHPRRPASLAVRSEPQAAAAWQSIPTTVLLGRLDEMVSDRDRERVVTHFDDVRFADTDHFIIFREPQLVADIVIDKLDTARGEDG
jgi:Alpha/beta hydrolase family